MLVPKLPTKHHKYPQIENIFHLYTKQSEEFKQSHALPK